MFSQKYHDHQDLHADQTLRPPDLHIPTDKHNDRHSATQNGTHTHTDTCTPTHTHTHTDRYTQTAVLQFLQSGPLDTNHRGICPHTHTHSGSLANGLRRVKLALGVPKLQQGRSREEEGDMAGTPPFRVCPCRHHPAVWLSEKGISPSAPAAQLNMLMEWNKPASFHSFPPSITFPAPPSPRTRVHDRWD